jgi:hypothetical protein
MCKTIIGAGISIFVIIMKEVMTVSCTMDLRAGFALPRERISLSRHHVHIPPADQMQHLQRIAGHLVQLHARWNNLRGDQIQ